MERSSVKFSHIVRIRRRAPRRSFCLWKHSSQSPASPSHSQPVRSLRRRRAPCRRLRASSSTDRDIRESATIPGHRPRSRCIVRMSDDTSCHRSRPARPESISARGSSTSSGSFTGAERTHLGLIPQPEPRGPAVPAALKFSAAVQGVPRNCAGNVGASVLW